MQIFYLIKLGLIQIRKMMQKAQTRHPKITFCGARLLWGKGL